MRALRSGNVPSCKNSRKSATYPLISFVVGNSARPLLQLALGLLLAAVSWSWRLFRDRMRRQRLDGQLLGLKGLVEVLQPGVHVG